MEPAGIGLSLVQRRKIQFNDGLGAGYALRSFGRRAWFPQDHVLRNQTVGRTRRFAASGPRFCDRDLDQDVLDIGLGIFHEHIEVAIVVEYTRIE